MGPEILGVCLFRHTVDLCHILDPLETAMLVHAYNGPVIQNGQTGDSRGKGTFPSKHPTNQEASSDRDVLHIWALFRLTRMRNGSFLQAAQTQDLALLYTTTPALPFI